MPVEHQAPEGGVTAKKYILALPTESRTVPIDASLAENEAELRDTLSRLFAGMQHAEILREERDGEVHITVIPRPGRKGCHEDCPHNAQAHEAPPAEADGGRPKRVFRKTVLTVVVLSVDDGGPRPSALGLDSIFEAITTGDCSGDFEVTGEVEIAPKEMARLLRKQASDPAFFGLDEEGNDLKAQEDAAARLLEEAKAYEDEYVIRTVFRRPPSAQTEEELRRSLIEEIQHGYDVGPLAGVFDTKEIRRGADGDEIDVVFIRSLESDAWVAAEHHGDHSLECALTRLLEDELGEATEQKLLRTPYTVFTAELTSRANAASTPSGDGVLDGPPYREGDRVTVVRGMDDNDLHDQLVGLDGTVQGLADEEHQGETDWTFNVLVDGEGSEPYQLTSHQLKPCETRTESDEEAAA